MGSPYVADVAAPVEPRLCTVDAAAQALALSPRMVRRLIAEGQLTSLKVGSRRLVPTAALDEFVARTAAA